MKDKENIVLDKRIVVCSIAILVLLVFGISYAYFTAQDESGTQTITTAMLKLDFDDNTAIINAKDIKPITTDEVLTKAAKKTFTIKKFENSEDIYTKIELTNISMKDNSTGTASDDLAKYDLKWALYQGTDIKIATGDFGGKTSGNIVLATNQLINSTTGTTYNLYIWINETGLNQSSMMGQTLQAVISASGTDEKQNTLASVILGENNANVLPGEYNESTDYTYDENIYGYRANYTPGLYAQQGDTIKSEMGFPTYYYRGNVTNNYVKFADQTWRIVRINEDGSIRLITESAVGSSIWDSSEDTSYIIDYGKDTQRNSTIKTEVENWYNSRIGNNSNLDSKVVTSSFCNDNIGKSHLTFVCPAGSINAYEKVGLITLDEAYYAGVYKTDVSIIPYFCNGSTNVFWTNTTSDNTVPRQVIIDPYGFDLIYSSEQTVDIRAVINLSPDVIVTGGDGLSANTAYTIE